MTALAVLWSSSTVGWQVPNEVRIVWVDTALGAMDPTPSVERAALLWARVALAYNVYDLVTTAACGELGLGIARELGNDRLAGRCLSALAWAGAHAEQAGQLWEEAIAASRAGGDTYLLVNQLTAGLGAFHLLRDPDAARVALDEARSLLVAGGLPPATDGGVSLIDGWLGLLEGRVADATAAFDQARRHVEAVSGLILVAAEGFSALGHALAGSADEALATWW